MGKRYWIIFFVFLFNFLLAKETLATCSVSISPADVQINSSRDVVFTVNNTGENPILFVKIPTGFDQNVSVTNVTASGWDLSLVSGGFGMVYGNVNPGSSANFTVNANFGSEVGSINWLLEASELADGSNAFICESATTNVVVETSEPVAEITPTPTAVPAPSISNIAVSASDTSAVLTWRLDSAASGIVYYGKTNSYGSNINTGSEGYEKATLTGLTPSTTYHFQIQIIGAGGTTVVADNTFVTAAAGAVSTVTTTVTNTVTNTVVNTLTQTNTNTVTKIIGDSTPPALTIKELDRLVWASAPVVSGSAIDNRGVSRVEYRLKTETTWQEASLSEKSGDKKTGFEFLPGVTLDGTYEIELRAIDVFGNRSQLKTVKFVIDQLPPTIGGGTVKQGGVYLGAFGGEVKMLADTIAEVEVYELGGSEKITLKIGDKSFVMRKILGTNKWKTELRLTTGKYQTEFLAVDGAGKSEQRKGFDINIVERGRVLSEGVEVDGNLQLFWKDMRAKRFVAWKGEGLEQSYEQVVGGGKKFGYILPTGEYFLKYTGKSGKAFSQTFRLVLPTVIGGDWEIGKASWWSFVVGRGKVFAVNEMSEYAGKGGQVLDETFAGKRKIVLFVNPELAGATENFMRAKEVAKEEGRELSVVGVQVSEEKMQSWLVGEQVEVKGDLTGEWIKKAKINLLPKMYWLNAFGSVEKFYEGLY